MVKDTTPKTNCTKQFPQDILPEKAQKLLKISKDKCFRVDLDQHN